MIFENATNSAKEIKKYLSRSFRLMKPYWSSEHKKEAWILLGLLLAIEGIMLYLLTKLNYATADLFNSLDQRNEADIWNNIFIWFGLIAALLTAYIVKLHANLSLVIRWRRFLTNRFITNYLGERSYNQLELKNYDADNPDQRIAVDLHNIAEETLLLGLSTLSTIGRMIVFSVILWKVSGNLALPIGGAEIVIPGYMFWVAIIYAVAGTWLVHYLAHPLTRLNFERQTVEADFRYQLVRLRENTESIALLKGEAIESQVLKNRFGAVFNNWMQLLKYKKRLLASQMGIGQLSEIVPYIAAMPALMAGTIGLGGFLQLRMAFGTVEGSLMFFVNYYERIAVWKSSVDRVLTLEDALAEAEADRGRSGIERTAHATNFEVEDLSLNLPSGDVLIPSATLTFAPNQDVIITGASGSGKSTLFRALSGLWVWGDGTIRVPDANVMFLPQSPYLPIGKLRDVLTYPHPSDGVDDKYMRKIVKMCQLGKFVDQLDESADWSRMLSGGEKQRLSFVRAILARPDWLFLDEATASLDLKSEAVVYEALKSELPNTTLVSIAHRESLKKYHNIHMNIDPSSKSFSTEKINA